MTPVIGMTRWTLDPLDLERLPLVTSGGSVKILFDKHVRTIAEDRTTISRELGLPPY
jgi:hypothetical protein